MMCLSRRAFFGAIVIVTVLFSCYGPEVAAQNTKGVSMPSAELLAKANITYKLIKGEGGGYGYDVFADEKRLIHQPTIPGQPGVAGFKKKSDAEKVAKLVIRKLRNGQIPPAITEEELRELKVIQ